MPQAYTEIYKLPCFPISGSGVLEINYFTVSKQPFHVWLKTYDLIDEVFTNLEVIPVG